jgi:hypothetical protein
MLTGDQIDYLLKIEDTKPPLPDRTVRVMLYALRWAPEEVERGINFLKRAPSLNKPKSVELASDAQKPSSEIVSTQKPIIIKQDPFPVGSPLIKNTKNHSSFGGRVDHFKTGIIVGGIIFMAGLFAYVYFKNNS